MINRFLFSIDPISKELYILHREYPRCLIHVRKSMPAKLVIKEIYDEIEDMDSVANMTFVKDARDFLENNGGRVFMNN